jgi:hypothetical protein
MKYIDWQRTEDNGMKDRLWLEYKNLKREFCKEERHAKEAQDEAFGAEMEEYHHDDLMKYWRKCKIKCQYKIEPKINQEKAAEHFYEFFKAEQSTKNSQMCENYQLHIANNEASTRETMKKIISELKNNKSPGYHGISNEHFKYADNEDINEVICQMLENMVRFNIVPSNMNIGIIRPIVKDVIKSHQDLNNTRPITISETIPNIIEKNLLEEVLHNRTSNLSI